MYTYMYNHIIYHGKYKYNIYTYVFFFHLEHTFNGPCHFQHHLGFFSQSKANGLAHG